MSPSLIRRSSLAMILVCLWAVMARASGACRDSVALLMSRRNEVNAQALGLSLANRALARRASQNDSSLRVRESNRRRLGTLIDSASRLQQQIHACQCREPSGIGGMGSRLDSLLTAGRALRGALDSARSQDSASLRARLNECSKAVRETEGRLRQMRQLAESCTLPVLYATDHTSLPADAVDYEVAGPENYRLRIEDSADVYRFSVHAAFLEYDTSVLIPKARLDTTRIGRLFDGTQDISGFILDHGLTGVWLTCRVDYDGTWVRIANAEAIRSVADFETALFRLHPELLKPATRTGGRPRRPKN